jgi:hypothetical protein
MIKYNKKKIINSKLKLVFRKILTGYFISISVNYMAWSWINKLQITNHKKC